MTCFDFPNDRGLICGSAAVPERRSLPPALREQGLRGWPKRADRPDGHENEHENEDDDEHDDEHEDEDGTTGPPGAGDGLD